MCQHIATRFVAVALVAAVFGAVHPAAAVTLEEALAELAANHPAIRTDEERLNSADQRLRGTKAFFLPTVSLTGDYGYARIDSPTRRVSRGKPAKDLRETLTLNLTQNVFDGFQKNFERRGAEEDKAAASDFLDNTAQSTLFQGASAFVDVLRQSELVQLVQVNEVRVQRQLELENERLQAGQGLAADVLLARQRLQQARERRVVFNGSLQDSFTRYQQLFGEFPDPVNMETPIPPIDLLPKSLDEALRIARHSHPLIANATNLVDAARARQHSAQSNLLPRVDIVGRANYENDLNDTPGTRRDASVLVQATWDLFTGFSIQSNIAVSAFDHAANLSNLHLTGLRIDEEVRFAWQALKTGCERRFLLESALEISLLVLDQRRALQAAGRETALRVLDAETEVTDAQINLAAAVYGEMTTVYRAVVAVGRLDVGTLVQAAVFSRGPQATPSMLDWCRQYADLDLREDVVLRQSSDAAVAEAARADDPFAFRGDDLGSDDTAQNANPFAQPEAPATDDDPFAASDGTADDDDPFASIIDDEDTPEPDAGAGLSPLFDDDTSIVEDEALVLDETGDDRDVSSEQPAGLALGDDRELSLAEDAVSEPAPNRPIRAQEFFDFDADDDIYRDRDLDR
ncbi:MAG: TolC family protein [Alphaproteobacteria bacterium]|nr:TolC family protein [Alphaproteobacteria bacterium]